MHENHKKPEPMAPHPEEKMHEDKCHCEGENCCCDSHGHCCCCGHKKGLLKFLAALLIFLAGMGFHALISCDGGCPAKPQRPMPMAPMAQPEGQAGTIIIINTDGNGSVDRFIGKDFNHQEFKHKKECRGEHKKHQRKHFNSEQNIPVEQSDTQPQAISTTE